MSSEPAPARKYRASLAAFEYRDFRYWVAWRFTNGLAFQMKNVAVGWYVYSLTGSALALGMAGLISFIPSIAFALVTGHAADTYNRKLIVAGSTLLAALAMLAITTGLLLGHAPLWLIYLATFLIGISRAFSGPASQAITPNLVERRDFANAVTWFASCWQAATILGPAIGGLIYLAGPKAAFSATTLMFTAGALCVFMMRTNMDPDPAKRMPVTWQSLTAGLKFMRRHQVIMGAIGLDLVAVLFGGVNGLLPIIAKDILQIGPTGLGLLRSSPAVGAIGMAAFIAWYPISSKAGMKMLIAVGVFGAAIVLFGLSQSLYLSLIVLAIMGAADMVSVVIRHTMVQSETPDDMRGRVSAVNSIFIGASGDLGEFRAGTMAAAFGAIPAIVIGGIATMMFAAAWTKVFPQLAQRNRLVE